MVFRLTNQRDPEKTLAMTSETWYGIIDLVEMYGWCPLGTVSLEQWEDLDAGIGWEPAEFPPLMYDDELADYSTADYSPAEYSLVEYNQSETGQGAYGEEVEESRLVVLEEALNLAENLEKAFLDYEPMRVPASFFLFSPGDTHTEQRPSIGAISLLIEFCRGGAFWVERLARYPTRPGERA